MQDPNIAVSGALETKSDRFVSSKSGTSKKENDPAFDSALKSSQRRLNKTEIENDSFGEMPGFSPLSALQSMFFVKLDNKFSFSGFTDQFNSMKGTSKDIQANGTVSPIEQSATSSDDQQKNNNGNSSNQNTTSQAVKQLASQLAGQSSSNSLFPLGIIPFTDFVRDLEKLSQKQNIRMMADSIVENAKVLKSGQKTEMELQLKPEWLGNVTLKISSQDGKINIALYAGQASKELLESKIAELETMLRHANIAIGSLTVFVGGQNTGGNNKGQSEETVETTGILPGSQSGNAFLTNVAAAGKDHVLSALGLSLSTLSKEI